MKNLLLLIIFIGYSCVQHNVLTPQEVIVDYNKRFGSIPITGWNLEQFIEGYDSRYYSFYQKKGDTIFEISFDIFEVNDSSFNDVGYIVEFFHKSYTIRDSSIHYIKKENFSITYSEHTKSNEKHFSQGIYYYMYLYPNEFLDLGYSRQQYNYIFENIDSLAYIKGNEMTFQEKID